VADRVLVALWAAWQAMLPTCIFDFIFGEVVGIYHGMENFTGRK
jgi:hypothetical protein